MVSHLWKSVMPDLDTMERDRQLLDITHPNRELCQESAVSDIYMILGGGAKGGVTLAKKEVWEPSQRGKVKVDLVRPKPTAVLL